MFIIGMLLGIAVTFLVCSVVYINYSKKVTEVRRTLLKTEVQRCLDDVWKTLRKGKNPKSPVSHLGEKIFFYFGYSNIFFNRDSECDLVLLCNNMCELNQDQKPIQLAFVTYDGRKYVDIYIGDRFYSQSLENVKLFKEHFQGEVFRYLGS